MAEDGILKKTMLAGLGIYSITREKAQEIMTDLVKRGEMSKDEGAKFVKSVLDKAEDEVAHLKEVIDKQVNQAITKIKPTYEEEFKKLHKKIDKIAKDVEKLSK